MPPARKIPKLHKKSVAIRSGTKFTDIQKQEFTIGKELGQGGFGRIYEGVQTSTRAAVAIKVEPQENGPLFTEMHVYMRVLKLAMLEAWRKEKALDFLGLPHHISAGSFSYGGEDIRFLVIPKYGTSLETVRVARGGIFSTAETLAIARCVVHSLAYLHDQNYVHGDVKASNLMFADSPKPKGGQPDFSRVVLIDFGLARKLPDALVEKENKKQAHNGTALFTSCDAHRGCLPSFRGDLEILAHNMLYWLAGTLPWEASENDPEAVYQQKKPFLQNAKRELPKLVKDRKAASILTELYAITGRMDFSERMDLDKVEKLLKGGA